MKRLTRVIKVDGKSVVVYTKGIYEDTTAAEMEHKDVRNVMRRLSEYEDTGLDPEQIVELKDRDTAKPLIERHYEEPGEEPYIKYTCPNGCNIQPSRRSQFCSLCGQRLDWSGENDAVQ